MIWMHTSRKGVCFSCSVFISFCLLCAKKRLLSAEHSVMLRAECRKLTYSSVFVLEFRLISDCCLNKRMRDAFMLAYLLTR
jgi:hypothetical protein